MFLKVQ